MNLLKSVSSSATQALGEVDGILSDTSNQMDSVVAEAEQVPSLLHESEEGLADVLSLFDEAQLAVIVRDAKDLLERLGDAAPAMATKRLQEMQGQLSART